MVTIAGGQISQSLCRLRDGVLCYRVFIPEMERTEALAGARCGEDRRGSSRAPAFFEPCGRDQDCPPAGCRLFYKLGECTAAPRHLVLMQQSVRFASLSYKLNLSFAEWRWCTVVFLKRISGARFYTTPFQGKNKENCAALLFY